MFLYIKYGELVLKGKNRGEFVNCLYRNIRFALKEYIDIKINKQYDYLIISEFKENIYLELINILKRIPGINLIISAYSTNTEIKTIESEITSKLEHLILNKNLTFKVVVKRNYKEFNLDSMEIAKHIGHLLLEKFSNLKVDIHHPNMVINIEVKKNNTIFYFDKIKGIGGFPIGINGKVLQLISGGIDSPVAAIQLLKKGMNVDFLTFITPPHTNDDVVEKIKNLIKQITLDYKIEKTKFFVVNFTPIMHEIAHVSNKSYKITLMRRYFIRIASYIQKKYAYDALATGESLGQVASQTIQSMNVIDNVKKNLILRPLLTYDKSEIISLAKEYGTYDISILHHDDCCQIFVPKNPVTKPSIVDAKKLEKELEMINVIYKKILKDIKPICFPKLSK
ncbi:MAG: tRNA 4-thiouridine(8) synthase ThiI [Mycoplasmataceae bacterium]|jgi:thiamine biosynthesis protein ThiI|nr:tRNA 4-thiouridine(8) synthase ThiI [Mycoplasmataceae bacterium]